MKRNEATVDRVIRAILGVGTLSWAASLGWASTGAIALLVLAGILLLTAATGFCPLYRLLGISTYRPERAPADAVEPADYASRH